MIWQRRVLLSGLFLLGVMVRLSDGSISAQVGKEPEDVAVPTADGLRLSGTWYPGSLGKQADLVIVLHAYGSNTSKGPYATMAKEIQAKGFSVLTFDMRGHGKSTTNRTIGDAKQFVDRNLFPFNTWSGTSTSANAVKSIDVKNFKTNYYPHLLNDVIAARRFVDSRNDAGECNSGRIHIIADRDAGNLALLWTCLEFTRNGVNPIVPNGVAPNHIAGSDIMSITFLSPKPTTNTGLKNLTNKLLRDKERPEIGVGIKEKVAMAFVYNTEAEKSTDFASSLFTSYWGLKPTVKEDKELGKYLIEVKGAKLIGIDLMDEKLDTSKSIATFIAATKKKNVNGNDWKMRNATVLEPFVYPLHTYGIP